MKFNVKLEGTTPMMQHRMDDIALAKWELSRGSLIENLGLNDPDEHKALYHSYVNTTGKFYIPSQHIQQALINGGTYMKSKVGARTKSMKSIVAALFRITPDEIIIPQFDQIDKRSAVNKNVKARVMVVRPKWSVWEANFTLEVLEETITTEMIKDLFNYTGKAVGIGSYRPTNNGSFGQFILKDLHKVK